MIKKNIIFLLFLSLSVAAFGQATVEEVSLTNLSDVNGDHDDFVAVPYGEGIIYNTNGDKNPCDTCGFFHTLRFAQNKPDTDCGCAPSVALPTTSEPKYNFSTPAFSPSRKTMYVTQNFNKAGGGEEVENEREKKLKIVQATLNDQNAWTNFTDVSFNMLDYETAHPTISKDGLTMYFASDRPGGIGGMDIWKVTKNGDTWGEPTNLGKPINSINNEIFPNITADGKLYFSSNKSGGMGGLDVYSATMENGAWNPTNLGAPFNSGSDDLGYIEKADGESGYITSNRAGGRGMDDIYCWKVNEVPVNLAVEDKNTAKRLPGATIKMLDSKKVQLDFISDADGSANPNIKYRRVYTIQVDKEGYEPFVTDITAKELAMSRPYIVPLVPRSFNMTGDVKRMGTGEIEPGSKIVLHNITTGEKREVIADDQGNFTFENIYCFEDYELIAYKDDRESEKYPLPASAIDCTGVKPTVASLVLPVPPPPPAPVCACNNAGMLSLPTDETPKEINALGNRPEFGNVHNLDAAGFYNKLKNRYDRSKRDAAYLDEVFTTIGYPNGFADATEFTFSETTIPNGMTGNMGYTKRHKIKYVRLDASNERDLQAFRVSSVNGCDVYFMKSCGNLFFFCNN